MSSSAEEAAEQHVGSARLQWVELQEYSADTPCSHIELASAGQLQLSIVAAVAREPDMGLRNWQLEQVSEGQAVSGQRPSCRLVAECPELLRLE